MKYEVLGGRERKRERESLFRQGGLKRKERKGKERWGEKKGWRIRGGHVERNARE